MKAASSITAELQLLTCPGCGEQITATVTFAVLAGRPEVADGGVIELPVTTELRGFNVDHNCDVAEAEPGRHAHPLGGVSVADATANIERSLAKRSRLVGR